MKTVYRTPAGVEIGKYWEPPRNCSMDRDAIRLQTALIDPNRYRIEFSFDWVLWGASIGFAGLVVFAPHVWRYLFNT